jgi:flagellar biosynthesis/type III secretory pathway protein FliH
VRPAAPPAYPDLRDENAELRRALAALTGELARVRKDVREASEAELVRLACAVAERVVGEELSTDPGHIIAWAREGIEALDSRENVVVAIAADLGRVLPSEEWNELGPNVTVEIDAALAPSTCEVRSRTGVARIGAAARMGQMKTELGVEEDR